VVLYINQLSGLFLLNPALSWAFSFCFFSLAGIPFMAGFYAKLLVLNSYINTGYYFVAILAILTSVLSTANYLIIIVKTNFYLPIYSHPISVPVTASYVISFITTLLLFFLFKPASFLYLLSAYYMSNIGI